MPSFSCGVCYETINSRSYPMATTCGHIFCASCATFHLTASGKEFCPVCRTKQTLDQMIRLYPDWEDGLSSKDTRPASPEAEEEISSSPIHVRAIDFEAEQTANVVKRAIAGQVDPEDALLACNTFVNSVPDRHQPHINTENLREIMFQLTLMSTKLKDDHAKRVEKLEQELEKARASETRARRKVKELRDRKQTEIANLAAQRDALCEQKNEQIRSLCEQSDTATTEVKRLQVIAETAMEDARVAREEKEKAEANLLAMRKKYYVLKAKVDETKKAARRASKGRGHEDSDDLIVMG